MRELIANLFLGREVSMQAASTVPEFYMVLMGNKWGFEKGNDPRLWG